MTEPLIDKIILELARVGFDGRFSLYLNNEPLLDRRLPDLTKKVREHLPKATQYLNTNGDALTVDTGVALFAAGLNQLSINCYDKNRFSYLKQLASEIAVLVNGELVGDDIILGQPGDRSRKIRLRDKSGWTVDITTNRAGNVPQAATPSSPLRASCFRPFTQIYIRYNGDMVLCCCDWKSQVVFGNVSEMTIYQAFNSEIANRYRSHLDRSDRSLPLCNVCDFSGAY